MTSAARGGLQGMQRITTNLWFDTEAEEAADFYVSVFKNARIVSKAHYTEAGEGRAGDAGDVRDEEARRRRVAGRRGRKPRRGIMGRMAQGYSATKDQLVKRLKRIEGQVRGIEGMVEDERYCIDVLTQISAVQAALDKVALGLLDDHARHCVMGAGADQPEKTE